MKTNHNGHTLLNLKNRVMAVIDDAEHAQAAVETLERTGVPERELAALSGTEGAREIDAEGTYSGGVKHALRAQQRLTVEGHHLRRYQAELTRGHLVVDVAVHGRERCDRVVQILRSHGAHFINAYGPWTIESVAACRRSDMRVLIVEDDPLLGDALATGLKQGDSRRTGCRMAGTYRPRSASSVLPRSSSTSGCPVWAASTPAE